MILKHFRNSLIVGMLLEYMILNTRIYENVITTTQRRRLGIFPKFLDTKRYEDQVLKERREIKE